MTAKSMPSALSYLYLPVLSGSYNVKPAPDAAGPSIDNSSGSSGNRHVVPSSPGGSGNNASNMLSRLRSVTGAPLTPALKQELAAGAAAAAAASYAGSGVLPRPEPFGPQRPLDCSTGDGADINISPLNRMPSVTQGQSCLTADGAQLRDQHETAAQRRPSGSSQHPPQGSSEFSSGPAAKGFIASNMAVRGSVDSLGSGSSGDGINRIYRWMGNQQSPNIWNQQSVGGPGTGLPPAGPAGLAPAGSNKKNEKVDRAETWLVQE
jgi:hypothetical protein